MRREWIVRIALAALPALVCAQAQPPATTPAAQAGALGGLNVNNASLVSVIDILAQKLKINYILDPGVKGAVTINTYGEIKPVDAWQLLETILRINGAAIVQVGDLYRIVPVGTVARLPIRPREAGKELPDDERMVLNLIFLKFVTVADMAKLLDPFLGEGRTMVAYDAANLLLLLDNARNMRRTMEMIALFDNDTLASQRVRLFDVENGRPSDMAKELETVFKAMGLSEKTSTVRFMPIDRINTIIAVAPNPGVFAEVEKWVARLDVPIKATAGSVDNYVYRLKYGCAETVAMAVMQLYGGFYGGYGMSGAYGGSGYGGYGGPGGMSGGPGAGCGAQGGGFGGGAYGGGYGGGGYGGGYSQGMYPGGGGYGANTRYAAVPQGGGGVVPPGAPGPDLTGAFLGAAASQPSLQQQGPRVIPNPFDNTILVQGTPKEWDQVKRLVEQIDVPPRQVLIEAKIYEVNLTGAFSAGVTAFLQKKGSSAGSDGKFPYLGTAATLASGGTLTAGMVVGQSRELLGVLEAAEDRRQSKVISAPSIIATDNIPAIINVGTSVPTLASQAVSGVQVGGTSQFANTISTRNAGVTLNIVARVNPSGIVTLVVNQEVSAPQAPAASAAIQSPSFSTRNVSTQVTLQDGDTIAIGGIIQETDTTSSSGLPYLSRIPVAGLLFGARSTTKQRTELLVFMTPRIIYDTNQIVEASEEMRSRMKKLQKIVKEVPQ